MPDSHDPPTDDALELTALARWLAVASLLAEISVAAAGPVAGVVLGILGHPFWALLTSLASGIAFVWTPERGRREVTPSPLTVAHLVSGVVTTTVGLLVGLGLLAVLTAAPDPGPLARAAATVIAVVVGWPAGTAAAMTMYWMFLARRGGR